MSEENTEEVNVLEAQIKHLQAEIKALQQQNNCKDKTFHFRGQMQEALWVPASSPPPPLFQKQKGPFFKKFVYLHSSYMCGQIDGGGKEVVVSRLKEEVEELEEDLKLQTQMNGISLNSCSTKTLQSGKNACQGMFLIYNMI